MRSWKRAEIILGLLLFCHTAEAAIDPNGTILGKLVSFDREVATVKIQGRDYKFKRTAIENNKNIISGQVVVININWTDFISKFHRVAKK